MNAGTPQPSGGYWLTGATVYTDPARPAVQASVGVADGRVVYVGPRREPRRRVTGADRIHLGGAVIYPGWSDAHGHLMDLAEARRCLDLRGKQLREILAAVGRAAAGRSRAWIQGRGWDQNLWPARAFPTADHLSQVSGDNPVLLTRIDGHAAWVNSSALAAAGISRHTPDPPDGRILRDSAGQPTGILLENAIRLVADKIPPPDKEGLAVCLQEACAECAAMGLTAIGEATGLNAERIDLFGGLARGDRLAVRVYATISADRGDLLETMRAGPIEEGLLTVRAVKAYADGALGSRGAALLEDYADAPGSRGLLTATREYLEQRAAACFRHGWQLWTHALGDAACRMVLDALQAALEKVRPVDPRPRIEHAQVIAPSDLPRFAELGVIASIQPTHATSDMPWLPQRLGPQRVGNAHAYQSLLQAGARLAGGSDFPIESHNPLLSFYAAVTRTDLSGRPAGGWQPDQRLSPQQALRLFTVDNAYAMFAESRRGRLVSGYDADLTVLDRDVLAVPPEEMPQARVLLTMVAGRIVYCDKRVEIREA